MRVVVLCLVLVATGVCPAAAQVFPFALRIDAVRNEDELKGLIKQNTDWLRNRLLLQTTFLAEACELSVDERRLLNETGENALTETVKRLEQAVRNLRGLAPGVVIYVGPNVTTRADLDREDVTVVDTGIRNELRKLLWDALPGAWKKLDAERQRIDARRKQAAVLAEVSAIDEALFLSSAQRAEFGRRLAEQTSDSWWRPENAGPLIDPALEQLCAVLAGGRLGTFIFPEPDLAELLTDWQLATFKERLRPQEEERIVVQPAAVIVAPQPVVRQPAAIQQPAAPQPAAIQQPAAGKPAFQDLIAQQAAKAAVRRQVLQRRVVRLGPSLSTQERRLSEYLQRLIHELGTACTLSDSQREKLSLAGRLDINKWREKAAATVEQPPAGQEFIVQKVHVASGNSSMPVGIFRDPSSCFQRALQGRLLDSQKRQLEIAERERRDFERRALIEAAVVGFERTAALTSLQCEQLSAALNEAVASNDHTDGDWRMTCLRHIAELHAENLAVVLVDIQRPEVKRHQDEINAAARQFEARLANGAAPPPLMGQKFLLAE